MAMNPTQSVQDRPEGTAVRVAEPAIVVIVVICPVLLMISTDYWTSPMLLMSGEGVAVSPAPASAGSVVK
jgi:hypothetical protein